MGIRLRESARADDHKLVALGARVGDLVALETGQAAGVGEARGPSCPLPEAKRDRLSRRVVRLAIPAEAREYRERREREQRAIVTCQQLARGRGLSMKVVDVEMQPAARRVTVYFNAEDRVDFRELVRDIAREFHSRIEMRQVGARDTTKLMDGIGPCGRQLCCSSYLRRFEPISVRMAKAQDMPLTDNRL